jgi:hypothetical protein
MYDVMYAEWNQKVMSMQCAAYQLSEPPAFLAHAKMQRCKFRAAAASSMFRVPL